MEEIKVVVEIHGSRQAVWDYLSDHAGLKRFHAGVLDSRLERPGDTDPNGKGAIRFINAGILRFKEEITYFEAPNRYDYKIIECSLPLDHESGSVQLEPIPGGTRVVWTSRLSVPLPLVGGAAGWMAKFMGSEGFRGILSGVKKKVEAKAG